MIKLKQSSIKNIKEMSEKKMISMKPKRIQEKLRTISNQIKHIEIISFKMLIYFYFK